MAARKTAVKVPTSQLDWSDLKVLLALARGGSLSAAARELAVEHTTVGRRLAAAEAALATRLFDRTPAGFVPTQWGEVALEHARAIEEHTLALERGVLGRDARVAGEVRITALDPFVVDFLLPALPRLCAAHPELVVTVAADTRVVSLSRREADIAIRYTAPRQPELVGRRLEDVKSALYASKDYVARRGVPRSPTDLAGHDLVGFSPDLAGAPEAAWLVRHGRGARVTVRVTSPATQLAAIQAGLGLGIHACHAADRDPRLVRVFPQPLLEETWWAVVHVDMARAARVRAVLDFLSAETRAERARLAGRPRPRGRSG